MHTQLPHPRCLNRRKDFTSTSVLFRCYHCSSLLTEFGRKETNINACFSKYQKKKTKEYDTVVYNKKYIFGLQPCFRHKAPKILGISYTIKVSIIVIYPFQPHLS